MRKKFFCLLCVLAMLVGMLVFPNMAGADSDVYTVSNLAFTDLEDNVLEAPPEGSCMVRVFVTKNQIRSNLDSVILMAYSADGDLLSFNVLKGTMSVSTDTQFSARVYVPQGETLGYVKACVWDSIKNMNPLSNVIRIDANGTYVPEPEKPFYPETVTVYGSVTSTCRDNPMLDKNEIIFAIRKLEYDFSDCNSMQEVNEKYEYYDWIYNYYGLWENDDIYLKTDLDVSQSFFVDVKAQIKVNHEKTDYELVSVEPTGRTISATYPAKLVDDENYALDVSRPYICFYESETASKSTKYSLEQESVLYVNGIEMYYLDEDMFYEYIAGNRTGTVTLLDGDSNGYYEVVFVEYYHTAMVDMVDVAKGKITFSSSDRFVSINPNAETATRIYLDGEEILLSQLKSGDVLSFKCDENEPQNSSFYEIYVSRTVAEGMYMAPDPEAETVTIGGNTYEFVFGYNSFDEFILGDEYKLYLDYFGRIFEWEIVGNSLKLAIIDQYTKSSEDDYYRATLYTFNGEVLTPQVDTTRVWNFNDSHDVNESILEYVYADGRYRKNPIQNRVVSYKISSSSGDIIGLHPFYVQYQAEDATYKSSTGALDGIKIAEGTKIIYAADYCCESEPSVEDLKIINSSYLNDGIDYSAYSYGERNKQGCYDFVILTNDGTPIYGEDASLAVLEETPMQVVVNDEDLYKLVAVCDGESKTLYARDYVLVNSGQIDLMDTGRGDAFVFAADEDGYLEEIDFLFDADSVNITDGHDAIGEAAENKNAEIFVPQQVRNWTTSWSPFNDEAEINPTENVTRLLFGPVVEKRSEYFKLGSYGAFSYDDYDGLGTSVNTDIYTDGWECGSFEATLTENTNVIVFDSKTKTVIPGTKKDLKESIIPDAWKFDDDIIAWGYVEDRTLVNYAFAKIVDGVATDVYVMVADVNQQEEPVCSYGLLNAYQTTDGETIATIYTEEDRTVSYVVNAEQVEVHESLISDFSGTLKPISERMIGYRYDLNNEEVIDIFYLEAETVSGTLTDGGWIGTVEIPQDVRLMSSNQGVWSEDNELNVDSTYEGYFYQTEDGGILMIETENGDAWEAVQSKYAVIEKYTKSSADDYYRATLYTFDGVTLNPQVDTAKVRFNGYSGYETDDAILNYVYDGGEVGSYKNPIQDRVVCYRISPATGNIVSLEAVPCSKMAEGVEFDAAAMRVGGIKLNTEIKMIDATAYVAEEMPGVGDLTTTSVSSFVDENEYVIYAYGDCYSDGTYPYTVVTYAGGLYNKNTNIAVVQTTPVACITNGEDAYKLTMLYQGEKVTMYANDDVIINGADDPTYLSCGDIIVYAVDNKGNIKNIDVLLTADDMSIAYGSYEVKYAAESGRIQNSIAVPWEAPNWTTSWCLHTDDWDYINPKKEVTRLVFGPILEKKPSYFTIGTYSEEGMSFMSEDIADSGVMGGYLEVDISDETNVYVYDYSLSSRSRLNIGTVSSIQASAIPEYLLSGYDYDVIEWGMLDEDDITVHFAFAKVMDGVATDVFVILSK